MHELSIVLLQCTLQRQPRQRLPDGNVTFNSEEGSSGTLRWLLAQQKQAEVCPSGKQAGLGPHCFQELVFATYTLISSLGSLWKWQACLACGLLERSSSGSRSRWGSGEAAGHDGAALH